MSLQSTDMAGLIARTLVLSFLCAANLMQAQNNAATIVLGKILDGQTGQPLENVNVFLSNTTHGTSSLSDGKFIIPNIRPGTYDLVGMRAGYERSLIRILVLRQDSLRCDVSLKPKVIETAPVEVIGERVPRWNEDLEFFTREFLGSDGNADHCRILNPAVLRFHSSPSQDSLFAAADSILRIENLALGYRLEVVLADFRWNVATRIGHYVIYTKLSTITPSSSEDSTLWARNRDRCYQGSLRQFLHQLFVGAVDIDQYSVFSGPLLALKQGQGHMVDPLELVDSVPGTSAYKKLRFPGVLRVEFGRRSALSTAAELTQPASVVSLISLKDSAALFDVDGNLIDPLSMEVGGSWSKMRLADFLPTR